MARLTAKQFEDLARTTRLGQRQGGHDTNRTFTALRRHLVDGMSIADARREQDISNAAFHAAMKRLFKGYCPHCGQKLPRRSQ